MLPLSYIFQHAYAKGWYPFFIVDHRSGELSPDYAAIFPDISFFKETGLKAHVLIMGKVAFFEITVVRVHQLDDCFAYKFIFLVSKQVLECLIRFYHFPIRICHAYPYARTLKNTLKP